MFTSALIDALFLSMFQSGQNLADERYVKLIDRQASLLTVARKLAMRSCSDGFPHFSIQSGQSEAEMMDADMAATIADMTMPMTDTPSANSAADWAA